jgi:hypothetical protein
MPENTKQPPNQDQRQRTPQGDPSKPQKPGGPAPTSNPGGRQGVNNPNKPGANIDQDMPERGKPGVAEKIDVDDMDDDEAVLPPGNRG